MGYLTRIKNIFRRDTVRSNWVRFYRWLQHHYLKIFIILFLAMALGVVAMWYVIFYTPLLSTSQKNSVFDEYGGSIFEREVFESVVSSQKERQDMFFDTNRYDEIKDPFYEKEL